MALTNLNLVFAPLDPATGSLVGSSVFASSQNCTVAYGARLNGNKINCYEKNLIYEFKN